MKKCYVFWILWCVLCCVVLCFFSNTDHRMWDPMQKMKRGFDSNQQRPLRSLLKHRQALEFSKMIWYSFCQNKILSQIKFLIQIELFINEKESLIFEKNEFEERKREKMKRTLCPWPEFPAATTTTIPLLTAILTPEKKISFYSLKSSFECYLSPFNWFKLMGNCCLLFVVNSVVETVKIDWKWYHVLWLLSFHSNHATESFKNIKRNNSITYNTRYDFKGITKKEIWIRWNERMNGMGIVNSPVIITEWSTGDVCTAFFSPF
jgi:hypothetical protein